MPHSRIDALDQYQIGLKLRTLRTTKQWTLSRLATETGLSTALLSKLETDRMIPTLQTLSKICTVYGASLSYFFSDPSKHTLAVSRREHFSPIRSFKEMLRGIPVHQSPIGTAQFDASMFEFPENQLLAASEPGKPLACIVYVVEGTLKLDVGGIREVLIPGDCACIDTDMSVLWGSEGPEHCRALLVNASGQ